MYHFPLALILDKTESSEIVISGFLVWKRFEIFHNFLRIFRGIKYLEVSVISMPLDIVELNSWAECNGALRRLRQEDCWEFEGRLLSMSLGQLSLTVEAFQKEKLNSWLLSYFLWNKICVTSFSFFEFMFYSLY